jgi:hypothetical protein
MVLNSVKICEIHSPRIALINTTKVWITVLKSVKTREIRGKIRYKAKSND